MCQGKIKQPQEHRLCGYAAALRHLSRVLLPASFAGYSYFLCVLPLVTSASFAGLALVVRRAGAAWRRRRAGSAEAWQQQCVLLLELPADAQLVGNRA